MREFELECVICNLEIVLRHAIAAGMDEHFISDLKHLISTANENKEKA